MDYVDNILKCAKDGLEKPEDFGYWGYEDTFVTWGFCGIDKHNASKIFEIVNFDYISNDLMNRFPDDFRIEGFKHWAVGHIDRLVCRILKKEGDITESNITKAFYAAMEWQDKLQDYPIADDDTYYDLMYNEAIDTIKNCLPSSLLEMIDTSDEDWADKLYREIEESNSYDWEFSPPKDDEILKSAFYANLWNKEKKEEWRDFLKGWGKDPDILDAIVPGKYQMKLFGDNYEQV